ncbi:hypothetical protein ACTWQF_10555 [Streptomyces sp. 8N114]|uniref:hypothetical protein n=1 Tax=Streptomyces sp. 8N114 TaxID=3457419 RepID=UPI003FCFCBEF
MDGDWDLVANKAGTTRLGFCLMLKFFEIEGRFPDLLEEVPQAAVEYVAGAGEGAGGRVREVRPDQSFREEPPQADPGGAEVPSRDAGG